MCERGAGRGLVDSRLNPGSMPMIFLCLTNCLLCCNALHFIVTPFYFLISDCFDNMHVKGVNFNMVLFFLFLEYRDRYAKIENQESNLKIEFNR